MKNAKVTLLFLTLMLFGYGAKAQEPEIETLFGSPGRTGGYGAISNKFTTINGEFANLVELYGGWYINQQFLIGAGFAGTTNHIPVPLEASVAPGLRMSYQYGQVGLVTEYVLASNKAVHLSFRLMTGGGFSLQYHRPHWDEYDDFHETEHDMDWFFVAEPGVNVEFNLFKWMRFSPGVSYRFVQGADGSGLSNDDLSGASVNLTFKFGRF